MQNQEEIRTQQFDDGSVYKGQFKYGLMHGYGSIKHTESGVYYIGQFRYGKREGYGFMLMNPENGQLYMGHWREDKPHGLALLEGNGQKVKNTVWQMGKLIKVLKKKEVRAINSLKMDPKMYFKLRYWDKVIQPSFLPPTDF